MISLLKTISNWLILFASNTGYWGFFVVMIIESTSLPLILPAEIVLVSAGYLVGIHKLNFFLAIVVCTTGSVIGALLNYYAAFFFGRKLIEKYGRYIFLNKKRFERFELVFNSHAGLITFCGRFLPLIKHIVSIPPGLSRMNIVKFLLFTGMGSLLLNTVIIKVGIEIGENFDSSSIGSYLEIGFLVFLFVMLILYYIYTSFAKRIERKYNDNSIE